MTFMLGPYSPSAPGRRCGRLPSALALLSPSAMSRPPSRAPASPSPEGPVPRSPAAPNHPDARLPSEPRSAADGSPVANGLPSRRGPAARLTGTGSPEALLGPTNLRAELLQQPTRPGAPSLALLLFGLSWSTATAWRHPPPRCFGFSERLSDLQRAEAVTPLKQAPSRDVLILAWPRTTGRDHTSACGVIFPVDFEGWPPRPEFDFLRPEHNLIFSRNRAGGRQPRVFSVRGRRGQRPRADQPGPDHRRNHQQPKSSPTAAGNPSLTTSSVMATVIYAEPARRPRAGQLRAWAAAAGRAGLPPGVFFSRRRPQSPCKSRSEAEGRSGGGLARSPDAPSLRPTLLPPPLSAGACPPRMRMRHQL